MTIDEAINDMINSAQEYQMNALGELYKNFIAFLENNKEYLNEEATVKARLKFKVLLNNCSQIAFNRVENEK